MPEIISKIIKRSGEIVDFDQDKIATAIYKAAVSSGQEDRHLAKKLTDQVVLKINKKFHKNSIPAVEEIQDLIEEVLMENGHKKIAKDYILYREQHRQLRDINAATADEKLMEDYLGRADWRLKENSNMSFSVQGLNNYVASSISARYWLNKMYPENIRKSHVEGNLHIHDLGLLAPYCCGWDLKDLLLKGFRGVSEKIQSNPPKHFRSALGQIINFFYTLQGESAGAQAFANFDTYLAPFIRYDKLDYKDVKQGLQEFMFNINVPTRVGFQCLSEDTEILGKDGWKKYNEVTDGDSIATFNMEKEIIEYLPVNHVFSKEYAGVMFNLKNRISDQLISPEHRVVRRKFSGEGYVLEKIEEISDSRIPFIVPVGSNGKIEGEDSLNENVINLIAWVVSEGVLDLEERGDARISIYQSEKVNPDKFKEIINTCSNLNLKYTKRIQQGLGEKCNVIKFDAESTRKILSYFNSDKTKGIKFIPNSITNSDVESSKIFLETYIKGDCSDACKICTSSKIIKDQLMQVIVNAGYGATTLIEKPDNELSKKDRYIIRIIKHQDTYINKLEKVDYKGIIWCPNTKNETVIARRKGKIFITGNSPFTNITLDVTPSPLIGEESVVIGGQPMPGKYKDFQKEMDMFNKAFAEIMLEGDSTGRVFGFPIPTYSIDKDFPWDKEALDPVWEMTAKYGIPYFSNFVNSDMERDDARSMCLFPEEDILIKQDNNIQKLTIGELFNENKGKQLDDEWYDMESPVEALSLNPKSGKLEWVGIQKMLRVVEQSLVNIRTKDGKTMKVSPDHLVAVYTEGGIITKKAGEVDEDDFLLVMKDGTNVLQDNQETVSKELAWFMGLFVADGNYLYDFRKQWKNRHRGVQVFFNRQEKELIEKTKATIKNLLGYDMKFILDPRYENSLRGYIYNSEFAKKMETEYDVCKYERLPKWIWSSSADIIDSFIKGFFDGDGYTNGKEIHINDQGLAEELNLLFQLIGISTSYVVKNNSQVIRIQHTLGRGAKGDKIIKDKMHNQIPEFLVDKKHISSEEGKKLYQSYGCKTVELSLIDRWGISNESIEWLRNSDFAVVKVAEIISSDLDYDQEFFDIELEKNHYFVHSQGNITHNCCRLRLDNRELRKRGGGLFGANPLTGSLGVATINLPRLGYLSKTKEEFKEKLIKIMELAKESLEIKRKIIEKLTKDGLYPYSMYYLEGINARFGSYWRNHFSTIGINGMNEAILNLMGKDIGTKEGEAFASEILDFMRERLMDFQNETNNLYNLEATPGEGCTYRFAKKDQELYPGIICANYEAVKKEGAKPYYTNSTHLHVSYTDDIFSALDVQDKLQTKYTGGTVLHGYLGERLPNGKTAKKLVQKIVNNYKLPYFTITPTFSICPKHGYLSGEHKYCPKCDKEIGYQQTEQNADESQINKEL